jgi:acyl carrier protein
MEIADIEGIKEKIGGIIEASANFKPSELSGREGAHLNKDLGIDSLTLLEIALNVDQEFATDFSEEELLGMESIQKAAEMVFARLGSRKAEA